MVEKQELNIKKIANLSMLTLSEAEKLEFSKDLEEIIGFAESIMQANTANNSKPSSNTELKNVFREDTVTNTENREELLKNAATHDGKYISVPKILGGN